MIRSVLSNTPTIMAFASGPELATLKSSLMPIPSISIRYWGASGIAMHAWIRQHAGPAPGDR